jgi:hypothetical protein
MVKETAAVLVIRKWKHYQVGQTVVLPHATARQFASLGILRIISPFSSESVVQSQRPDEPMKGRRLKHGD